MTASTKAGQPVAIQKGDLAEIVAALGREQERSAMLLAACEAALPLATQTLRSAECDAEDDPTSDGRRRAADERARIVTQLRLAISAATKLQPAPIDRAPSSAARVEQAPVDGGGSLPSFVRPEVGT